MKLRLNKFLSRAGFGARRKVEELILGGIVQVNGTICKNLGKVIDTEVDIVKVEGKRARLKPLLYYAFYKPKGVVSTLSDPLNRKCIGDFMINLPEGLKPVGRLDYSAEGLIFLTNDGDWAQIIQHPKNKVKKVYEVKVQGFPAEKVIQKWLRGFKIDGKFHKMENIKIIKNLDQQVPILLVDANQIQQVFMNILLNAADAMPEGGNLQVSSLYQPGDDYVQIIFTDTGCGIPTENLDKIFDPFFTTKSDKKGTGLGLAVSYGIIERHRGHIEVQSTVGQGTTFVIKLPVQAVAEVSP